MERRYDIDWVRVIAIALLIVYHSSIAFQPWGTMLAFITNKEPWPALWLPMALLNVWRIPLLFFVSGMGVYFAMRSRTPGQLIGERAGRILMPFVFGIFFIVPIQILLWRYHNGMKLMYVYDPAHLWFLGNIFAYVLIFTPLFFWWKKNTVIPKIFSTPIGVLLPIIFLIAEVLIIKPYPYELYAMTWHGFFLGMICFFFGYCFAFTGTPFWQMIVKWRWIIFGAGIALAVLRLRHQMATPTYMIPAETVCWVLSMFIIGYQFLDKPGKALTYLSEAAYPVYIIHMILQNLGSTLIFRLDLPVYLKFVALVIFTMGGCLLVYEFLIRRTKVTRFVFGLKQKPLVVLTPTTSVKPVRP